MAVTTPAAVANAFLDIQDADNSQFPKIDQMKLQKLVYYAHAWWLAIKGEPLFDEDVQAWPWGPVIPSLYGEFRGFGKAPIAGRRALALIKNGPNPMDWCFQAPASPPEEVQDFLKSVWEGHKQLTGIQLSNATHFPGEPWTIIKDRVGGLEGKPMIPNELIKDVFKGKLPQ